MTEMCRRWVVVARFAVACKSPRSEGSRSDETRAPAPVPMGADAGVADAQTRAAVDLGLAGENGRYSTGVRSIVISGERVLWSTLSAGGPVTIRSVPRGGGSIETIVTLDDATGTVEGHRNFALLGDKLVVIGASRARTLSRRRAPLFEVDHGKPRVLALGPARTAGSTGLLAHDGKLYWTAAGTTGSGPVMETTATGATRTVLCEPDGPYSCEHHVLDGVLPIATDGEKLWKLGARAEPLPVTCPLCTEFTTVVGETHVLCTPTPAADVRGATCKPVPTLVTLDGTGTHELPETSDAVQRAAGRYYYLHAATRSLRFRPTLDGADEVFAENAVMFTADDRGVVWLGTDQHLRSAPH